MAIDNMNTKPLDLENIEADPEQRAIEEAAQVDKVVHGVNGSAEPRARRLRPLAGLIIIAMVVFAALYMRHGMANRNRKTIAQTESAKIGVGPATNVERGLLSDEARSGLDTGQTHVPGSLAPRSSILGANGPTGIDGTAVRSVGGPSDGSVPPLEYRPNPVSAAADSSLSFAQQRKLDEYKREMEAMEAPTSIKSNLPSKTADSAATSQSDPLQAIQAALLNARAAQGLGSAAAQPTRLQAAQSGQDQRTDYERQNDQQQKAGFGAQDGKDEASPLGSKRTAPVSRYEIEAGWLIPAVLEQQLNSDLPGLIRALVRENVYDSATGQYILIPAGSTLIGIYNSHIGYGQNALQAVWRRVIFPDGSSISIGGFEGDDSQGSAGFRDQVDNHWRRILSGALLTSLFAAGIELSQGTNSSVLQSPSAGQQAGQAVGQQVGQLGVEVTRRNLNVQPTIVVRPGYRFFVRVEKDMSFDGPYSPGSQRSGIGPGFGGRQVGDEEDSPQGKSRWAAVDPGPGGNDAPPSH
jgi:type IV secretory pathway VirB10-like protein